MGGVFLIINNVNISEIIKSWLHDDAPIGGVLMAFSMAILRMIYAGETKGKTFIEGFLCGALTLTASSAMNYFNMPNNLTVAIGGFIGFVGVRKISSYISIYFEGKLGLKK